MYTVRMYGYKKTAWNSQKLEARRQEIRRLCFWRRNIKGKLLGLTTVAKG